MNRAVEACRELNVTVHVERCRLTPIMHGSNPAAGQGPTVSGFLGGSVMDRIAFVELGRLGIGMKF